MLFLECYAAYNFVNKIKLAVKIFQVYEILLLECHSIDLDVFLECIVQYTYISVIITL